MTITQDFLTKTEALKQFYFFDKPEKVIEYLEENPFLIPLLIEAHSKIAKYFPNAPLYLEVYTFQNTGNNSKLFLEIVPSCEPEEAGEMLETFGDDWWLAASEAAQNKLEIMIEYR